MTMVKMALAGVVGTLLALQFKSGKSEYGSYLSIGVTILVFFALQSKLETVIEAVKRLSAEIGISGEYVGIMLKMLGITYVAECAGGICKDAGYQAVAGQIEIFAKLSLMVLSLPVLLALLDTIQKFLS